MENQFFVGQAEFKTGHVLRKDLSLFKTGGEKEEIYEVFNTEIEAKNYAKKKNTENPEIEYWVENDNGKTIFYVSKNEVKEYD